MPNFGRSSRAKSNSQSGAIPAENAIRFYLIILFSVGLPVAVAASIVFVPVMVDTVILMLLLAFFAGAIYAYRRFVAGTQEFVRQARLLGGDQETTISVLGGFLSVKIDHRDNEMALTDIMEDRRENGSEANPAGLLVDRRSD